MRDLRVRYRQTLLGIGWVVLQPVLAAVIFTFVFNRVAGLSAGEQPYFLFAYAGMVCWTVFANTMTRTTGAMVANAQLVSKVYFPRLLLPLSALVSVAVDALVGLAVLALLAWTTTARPTIAILWFPAWLVLTAALATALGSVLGALTVRYRDLNQILTLVLQLLLYASPVAYAASAVPPRYETLYYLNPLATLVEGFRWSTIGDAQPELIRVAYLVAVTLAAGATALVVFARLEKRFADVI